MQDSRCTVADRRCKSPFRGGGAVDGLVRLSTETRACDGGPTTGIVIFFILIVGRDRSGLLLVQQLVSEAIDLSARSPMGSATRDEAKQLPFSPLPNSLFSPPRPIALSEPVSVILLLPATALETMWSFLNSSADDGASQIFESFNYKRSMQVRLPMMGVGFEALNPKPCIGGNWRPCIGRFRKPPMESFHGGGKGCQELRDAVNSTFAGPPPLLSHFKSPMSHAVHKTGDRVLRERH